MPTNRSSRNTRRTALIALLTATVLTACGGGGSSVTHETSTDTSRPGTATTTPTTPVTSTQPVSTANANGRLLASNCFQCHGTEGTGGFENIRRKSAAELKKFLTVPAGSDIMAAHAQGYTVAQLDAIAAYLNQ